MNKKNKNLTDWENFANLFHPMTVEEVRILSKTIFRKFESNEIWSPSEDLLLESLILYTEN